MKKKDKRKKKKSTKRERKEKKKRKAFLKRVKREKNWRKVLEEEKRKKLRKELVERKRKGKNIFQIKDNIIFRREQLWFCDKRGAIGASLPMKNLFIMPCHGVHSVSLLKMNKGSCILFII